MVRGMNTPVGSGGLTNVVRPLVGLLVLFAFLRLVDDDGSDVFLDVIGRLISVWVMLSGVVVSSSDCGRVYSNVKYRVSGVRCVAM